MCLVGHWIGEAIILRWVELSYNLPRKFQSLVLLALLIIQPKNERNVSLAKNVYKKSFNLCVERIPLSQTRFDVDHVILFLSE